MATRNQIKERSIERVRRERAPIPWQYGLMGLLCAVILAFGFFFAAKQHFSSVEFSMKNSEMRKTKQILEAEQRKLRVEREEVASPAMIERAGLKIGLRKFTSDAFQFIDPSKNPAQSDIAKNTGDAKSKLPADKADKAGLAKITRTVSVRPVDSDRKESARNAKPEPSKSAAKDTGRTLIAKK